MIPRKEVSIDLWQSYKNSVAELIPNVQVVADRFDVMKGNVKDEYNYLPWNS